MFILQTTQAECVSVAHQCKCITQCVCYTCCCARVAAGNHFQTRKKLLSWTGVLVIHKTGQFNSITTLINLL